MLNPRRVSVVVFISWLVLLIAGCGISRDPLEIANEAISRANDGISEHNGLFVESRRTYREAREAIESGEDPPSQTERISQATDSLREARSSLEEARSQLTEIQDLEVEQAIKDYADTLARAIDAQLEAEARELEFYEILQEDPALGERRQEATKITRQASEGYERATQLYEEAGELADSNPGIIEAPEPEVTDAPPPAPAGSEQTRGTGGPGEGTNRGGVR